MPIKRQVAGSSHITYGEPALVRLTTDAPLSYIQKETPFALTQPLHLVFGPDEPFMGDISSTVRDFSSARGIIGANGCGACRSPMNGRKPPSAPPSP